MSDMGLLQLERKIILTRAFRKTRVMALVRLIETRTKRESEIEGSLCALSKQGVDVTLARQAIKRARADARTAARSHVARRRDAKQWKP